MSLPPERVEVGNCYLTKGGQVCRVIAVESGKVTYHAGRQVALKSQWPRRMVATYATFAAAVVREVACPAYYMVSETSPASSGEKPPVLVLNGMAAGCDCCRAK